MVHTVTEVTAKRPRNTQCVLLFTIYRDNTKPGLPWAGLLSLNELFGNVDEEKGLITTADINTFLQINRWIKNCALNRRGHGWQSGRT